MQRVEERTVIAAPAETIYDYVSDFARHAEWSGHGLDVTKDGDGPVAVGSTFSTTAKQFGTQREHSTVTEMAPGKRFAWESKGSLGLARHWFELTPSADGGSTTVVKGMEFAQPSFLAKLTSWRLARDEPKSLRSDLEKIKAKLEASTTG
jgi:uncharacterized membrane protein